MSLSQGQLVVWLRTGGGAPPKDSTLSINSLSIIDMA